MPDRRALRAVATQFWINGVVFASFIPRLLEIRNRLDVDLAQLGLLLTLGSVGGLAGSALCGPVIQRIGTKRTMIGGALGLTLSLQIIGFATAPAMFLVGLMAMHLFDVVTDVSMNLQGSWLSARRSTPVISRLHGLWSVGTVVGGIGASVAATAISLQVHLIVVAVIIVTALFYVAPGLLTEDERPKPIGDVVVRSARRVGLVFALLAVATIALEMVPADWSTIRLAEDLGTGDGLAGIGFVAFTIGMVIGRFSGDGLTVRLGPDGLARATTVVAGVGIAIGALSPVLAVSVAGFLLAGMGSAVLFPRLYDAAAQAPGPPGALLGAMTAGLRVGAFVIPITVGSLAATSALSVGTAMAMVALPGVAFLLLARN